MAAKIKSVIIITLQKFCGLLCKCTRQPFVQLISAHGIFQQEALSVHIFLSFSQSLYGLTSLFTVTGSVDS